MFIDCNVKPIFIQENVIFERRYVILEIIEGNNMSKFFLVFIVLSVISNAQYTWKKADFPEGGLSFSVYEKGDTMLAAVTNTIYYSTNKGAEWQRSTLNMKYRAYGFTHANDSTFLAIAEDGLYKSYNLKKWNRYSTYPYYNSIGRDKAGNLYLTSQTDLQISRDKGSNWSTYFTIPNSYFPSLLITDNYIFVTTKGGIYRKALAGDEAWEFFPMSIYFNPITLSSNKYGQLYAVSDYNPVIMKSTDEGDTWTEINLASYFPGIKPTLIASYKSTILVGNDIWDNPAGKTLYRSTDFGNTWQECIEGLPGSIGMLSILPSGDNFFAATYGYGIIKSNDQGRTWFAVNKNINEVYVNNFVQENDSTLFISTWGSGVMRSTDCGKSWSEVNKEMDDYGPGNIRINSRGDLFVSTRYGIFRSNDLGVSWVKIPSPQGDWWYRLYIDQSDFLYAIATDDIYLTNDDGVHWRNFFTNYDPSGMIFNKAGDVFVTTANSRQIFKSTNEGQNWASVYFYNFFGDPYISGNQKIFVPSFDGLVKSTDNGETWRVIKNGIINPFMEMVSSDDKGNYFASSYSGWTLNPEVYYPCQLYHSSDEGESWNTITGNLFQTTVHNISFINGRIFLATDHGIWIDSIGLSSIQNEKSIQLDFTLFQNYPNPFNPATTIQFSVGKRDNVLLKVYDILGREVKTLINEERRPGTYSVTFDASGLSSGVYIYRLNSGSYSESKTMILLK